MAKKKSETEVKDEMESSPSGKKKKSDYSLTTSDLISAIAKGYGEGATDTTKSVANNFIKKYLKQVVDKSEISDGNNLLILYDNSTMIKSDADNIYNAVTKFTNDKPLHLVLYSKGGSAASAYLIGKLCREYAEDKFIVTVPRYAKSAATMICCAANEIHMGSLSELGPIDPQINKLPALGLKNSIEHIAELVKIYPESSHMFASYLHMSLDLINLGYYERVAESAMQYAEQLLSAHRDDLPKKPNEIAYQLVYKYKDHGFVIDWQEAKSIFGDKIIKKDTNEYSLGNELYKELSLIEQIANILNYSFYFIGSLESDPTFSKRKQS